MPANVSVNAVLEALDANNASAYEMAVSAAQAARETGDNMRWVIGDIAGGIVRTWGKGTLQAFAKDVGLGRKTVYEYEFTASVFLPDERETYAGLSWSLFRLAARIDDSSARAEFLERAIADGWTVDEAQREAALLKGKTPKPATLFDGAFTVVNVNAVTGIVTLKATDAGADTYALQDAARDGVTVNVKVTETKNEVTQ